MDFTNGSTRDVEVQTEMIPSVDAENAVLSIIKISDPQRNLLRIPLEAEAAALAERMASVKEQINNLTPIHYLPPEILVPTFTLYLYSFIEGLYTAKASVGLACLLAVCRRWRNLVQKSPILWSIIDARSDERVAVMLEKAQGASLILHTERAGKEWSGRLQSILASHTAQLKDLHIKAVVPTLHEVLEKAGDSAPHLQSCYITGTGGGEDQALPSQICDWQVPNLLSFHCRRLSIPWDAPLLTSSVRTLTFLTIGLGTTRRAGTILPSLEQLVSSLNEMQLLKKLALHYSLPLVSSSPPSPPLKINLPHMQAFSLTSSLPQITQFLRLLSSPLITYRLNLTCLVDKLSIHHDLLPLYDVIDKTCHGPRTTGAKAMMRSLYVKEGGSDLEVKIWTVKYKPTKDGGLELLTPPKPFPRVSLSLRLRARVNETNGVDPANGAANSVADPAPPATQAWTSIFNFLRPHLTGLQALYAINIKSWGRHLVDSEAPPNAGSDDGSDDGENERARPTKEWSETFGLSSELRHVAFQQIPLRLLAGILNTPRRDGQGAEEGVVQDGENADVHESTSGPSPTDSTSIPAVSSTSEPPVPSTADPLADAELPDPPAFPTSLDVIALRNVDCANPLGVEEFVQSMKNRHRARVSGRSGSGETTENEGVADVGTGEPPGAANPRVAEPSEVNPQAEEDTDDRILMPDETDEGPGSVVDLVPGATGSSAPADELSSQASGSSATITGTKFINQTSGDPADPSSVLGAAGQNSTSPPPSKEKLSTLAPRRMVLWKCYNVSKEFVSELDQLSKVEWQGRPD